MSTPFYDLASLVVVPSGYKASKVYAQKPLTTDGQLTFSRASTATRVNSAGLIETVSSNVPRLDYLGSTCPKLLLEPQRTNLFTYSEQFDNAAWNKYNLGVTANAAISPDGTNNADKIFCNITGSAVPLIHQSPSYTNTTSTVSGYFKKAEYNFVVIHAFGIAGTVFNLNTGTIVLGAGTITSVGNGWYRCVAILNIGSDSQTFFTPSVDGSVGYTGTSGSGVFAWGAQAEASVSYATSYIPTTTAAVTRLADVSSKTSISSLIGQSAGTVYFEFNATGAGVNQEILGITLNGGGAEYIAFYNLTNGALYFGSSVTLGILIDANSFGKSFKCAYAYQSGSHVLYVNGSLVSSSTSSTVYSLLNAIYINQNAVGAGSGTLKTEQLLLFKTKLTNAQLAELTAL